ncbi:MAG: ribose 5-phosphate isomerase B [Clostridiales bacterium]|nr:ribose 5-phosphate isomerase B [Clostridiales bacterium]
MKIAIGCDEAACGLRDALRNHLEELGHIVKDFGTEDSKPVLYPDIAWAVAGVVAAGEYERGVLCCGTGIGMAITANKVPGIRAAVCHDPYSAERARKSNDAQILCMGARIVAPEYAKYLLELWLGCGFAGGGSAAKVERITYYEQLGKQ